jgi:hypothetical protein
MLTHSGVVAEAAQANSTSTRARRSWSAPSRRSPGDLCAEDPRMWRRRAGGQPGSPALVQPDPAPDHSAHGTSPPPQTWRPAHPLRRPFRRRQVGGSGPVRPRRVRQRGATPTRRTSGDFPTSARPPEISASLSDSRPKRVESALLRAGASRRWHRRPGTSVSLASAPPQRDPPGLTGGGSPRAPRQVRGERPLPSSARVGAE